MHFGHFPDSISRRFVNDLRGQTNTRVVLSTYQLCHVTHLLTLHGERAAILELDHFHEFDKKELLRARRILVLVNTRTTRLHSTLTRNKSQLSCIAETSNRKYNVHRIFFMIIDHILYTL